MFLGQNIPKAADIPPLMRGLHYRTTRFPQNIGRVFVVVTCDGQSEQNSADTSPLLASRIETRPFRTALQG